MDFSLLLDFTLYVISGVALLIVGTIVFLFTTKIKELELIGQGNKAASFLLGGRILALAIVIRAAISYSVDLVDMIIWGAIAIIAQIIIFYLAEVLTPNFNIGEAIEKDNKAVGMILMFTSISIGVIISGCLSY